ncbi:MAG TPA: DNA polymerase III subunit gamma/tau [Candidatus Paceibacterota bacterium]
MQVALYRKYRPGNFQEVIGQEHIVSVLENEAKTGKVSHAYLFSGSRGVGKTSIARIFSKTLGVSPDDIYEIDGASNRRIEDVRAIREAVHTLPYHSKYKVYIIDEVHMLTTEAFNALLKTLEEPPPHVIFILATTEAHKLPDTVVSRCEHFIFRKPSHKSVMESVQNVAKEEGCSLGKASASLIATLAEGSFRDALSTLQKIIHSSSDNKLSEDEVEKVLGAPKHGLVMGVIDGVANTDTEKALSSVRQASESNADMQIFLKMILRDLRFVLLLRFAKDMKEMVASETGEEEFEKLFELSKTAKGINSKTLINFLEAESRQKYASILELPIEIAIMKSCEVQV